MAADNSTDYIILGDSFLRSAYLVYDLENYQIGMAATVFNSAKSNIVPFAGKGARIPNSADAPNQDLASLNSVAITSAPSTYTAAAGFAQSSSGSRVLPWAVSWTGLAAMASFSFFFLL
jgi:hypothetical protein